MPNLLNLCPYWVVLQGTATGRNFLLVLSRLSLFSFKMRSFILLLCEWLGSHFYFPLKIKVVDTTLHFGSICLHLQARVYRVRFMLPQFSVARELGRIEVSCMADSSDKVVCHPFRTQDCALSSLLCPLCPLLLCLSPGSLYPVGHSVK